MNKKWKGGERHFKYYFQPFLLCSIQQLLREIKDMKRHLSEIKNDIYIFLNAFKKAYVFMCLPYSDYKVQVLETRMKVFI